MIPKIIIRMVIAILIFTSCSHLKKIVTSSSKHIDSSGISTESNLHLSSVSEQKAELNINDFTLEIDYNGAINPTIPIIPSVFTDSPGKYNPKLNFLKFNPYFNAISGLTNGAIPSKIIIHAGNISHKQTDSTGTDSSDLDIKTEVNLQTDETDKHKDVDRKGWSFGSTLIGWGIAIAVILFLIYRFKSSISSFIKKIIP